MRQGVMVPIHSGMVLIHGGGGNTKVCLYISTILPKSVASRPTGVRNVPNSRKKVIILKYIRYPLEFTTG